jgi:hypothetical protein
VYEALSCAQVLVYEALSDLEERDQVHFSAWGLESALIEP